MTYKYPYIADKNLFFAVKYACKIIRDTGFFNKACHIAAERYDIDEERIAAEIRKRQSAGQKGTTRKYKWFVIDEYIHYQYRDEFYEHVKDPKNYKVVRATNRDNASKGSEPFGWGLNNESYSVVLREVISEHETKQEAEEALAKERRAK